MKRIFLSLCLFSSTNLIADYTRIGVENPSLSDGNNTSTTSQNSHCSCGCQSCSAPPEPKKSIDLECYTPAYYDLDCASGLFVSVDFLYWFAKDDGLTYGLQTSTTKTQVGSFLINPKKFKSIEVRWDPGARVGIGYTSSCDGWDLYTTWTYFHGNNHNSISLPPFSATSFDPINAYPFTDVLLNPWIYPTGFLFANGDGSLIPYFNRISAQWLFSYNMFDLALGGKFWLSKCFSLRPYGGVRGGWTKASFSTTCTAEVPTTQFIPTPFTEINKMTFSTQFWGVGLLGGFQPAWHMGCGWSLFGNAEMALLWGNFDIKRKESLIRTPPRENPFFDSFPFPPSEDKFSAMQAMLDLGLGLRWESTFCCNRYRFEIDLAWENHLLFNHNRREKLFGSFEVFLNSRALDALSFLNFERTYGDVSLAGVTGRVRFDF